MRWLKRGMWRAAIATTGLLLLLVLMVWVPVSADAYDEASGLVTPVTFQETSTVDVTATMTALNEEKLQKDIEKDQSGIDKDRSDIFWAWTAVATFISVIGGVLTGLVTSIRFFNDRRAERDKMAAERFQSTVEELSSEREDARLGAAILLRTFLRPGYERFYRQVFDLAVANLRLQHANQGASESLNPLRQALAVVFKEAFPVARDQSKGNLQFLDARGVLLDSVYLEGADLKEAWMPQAFLRKADLGSTDLSEANLNGANLTSATLSKSNLTRAILSNADFSGAILNDANLELALLKDTNLHGVKGLSQDQLIACKAKGAIIDEDTTATSPQSTTSPPSPSQSIVQASSVPPAQVNTSPPSTDGSSSTSSRPSIEP